MRRLKGSIEDDLQWIMRRVRADLPQGQIEPRLYLDPAFADPARSVAGDDPSDAIVEVGNSRTRIGLEHGRESACRSVMSAVQDAVIDRTGRPWPDVVDGDGEDVGVLDVDVDAEGLAMWIHAGDVIGPVGSLVEACGARRWRIKQ